MRRRRSWACSRGRTSASSWSSSSELTLAHLRTRMEDFAGKVAVITGAASGFGREFARRAHARGMKLVLADVQDAALQEVVAELQEQGAETRALRVDVAHGEQV